MCLLSNYVQYVVINVGPVQCQWIISHLRLSLLTEDTSLLQCFAVCRSVFTVTVVSKASWVVMHIMNNHTYNAMRV